MIRWSYLLPRLALFVAILLVACFGLPVLLRWSIVRTIETATQSSVAVDRAWAWPLHGKMRVDGMQIARDDSSPTNLMEFRSATLSIDLGALTRRRAVIDVAELRGLQFRTPRQLEDSSVGQFESMDQQLAQVAHYGNDLGRQWLKTVAGHFQRKAEDEFESIQLAHRLAQQWPVRYDRLATRIDRCREQAGRLGQKLKQPIGLPVNGQQLAGFQRTGQQANQLRQEMDELRSQLEQLTARIAKDRVTVQEAFERDRQRVRELVQLAPLNKQSLNDALLNSQLYGWWDQIQPWLSTLQWLATRPNMNHINDGRGALIDLREERETPAFLVRLARFDGRLTIGGQDLLLVGTARNLTPRLDQLRHPATIQLVTQGAIRARVHVTLDRAGPRARQRITITADDLPLPAQTWGQADRLAVSLQPGTANVRIQLIVLDNALRGQIQLTAHDVRLLPVVAPQCAEPALQAQLTSAVDDIRSFELSAHLTGTMSKPRWKIQSDLGAALQARLQQAFQQALNAHARNLAEQARQIVVDQFESQRNQLAVREVTLTRQLDIGQHVVSSLTPAASTTLRPWRGVLQR